MVQYVVVVFSKPRFSQICKYMQCSRASKHMYIVLLTRCKLISYGFIPTQRDSMTNLLLLHLVKTLVLPQAGSLKALAKKFVQKVSIYLICMFIYLKHFSYCSSIIFISRYHIFLGSVSSDGSRSRHCTHHK